MTLSSTLLLTRCLSLSLSSSHSLSTYLLSLALSYPSPFLSFSLCVGGCVSHSLSFFSPTTLSISPTPRDVFQLSHFPPLSWCLIIFLILLSFLSSDTCEKFVWTSLQWIPLKGSQSGEDSPLLHGLKGREKEREILLPSRGKMTKWTSSRPHNFRSSSSNEFFSYILNYWRFIIFIHIISTMHHHLLPGYCDLIKKL